MNVITASKSVGQLSYFVRDLETLYTIILSGQLKQSKNQEYNKNKHEKSIYISLSRNLTAATIRNNDRCRYGIVIDGNRLSDRYHIEPYSFEYEERIWTNSNYINIKECILGVIFPKDELSDFETTKDRNVKAFRDLLDEQLDVYTVTYY